jgi:hypothetical protein
MLMNDIHPVIVIVALRFLEENALVTMHVAVAQGAGACTAPCHHLSAIGSSYWCVVCKKVKQDDPAGWQSATALQL